jgi:membrane protein YqaA with SNARE-associated domain
MRFLATLVIVCVVMALIGYVARDAATTLARSVVAETGLWGMALGTLLADGVQFPVPPQFYMLLAVASGTPVLPAFVAICAASLVAGYLGYRIAELASRLTWIERATRSYRELLTQVFERFGYRSALVMSLLPIPYSVLCYTAGLNRMPYAFLALLSLCRVPKLLGFYWLVYAGWSVA